MVAYELLDCFIWVERPAAHCDRLRLGFNWLQNFVSGFEWSIDENGKSILRLVPYDGTPFVCKSKAVPWCRMANFCYAYTGTINKCSKQNSVWDPLENDQSQQMFFTAFWEVIVEHPQSFNLHTLFNYTLRIWKSCILKYPLAPSSNNLFIVLRSCA